MDYYKDALDSESRFSYYRPKAERDTNEDGEDLYPVIGELSLTLGLELGITEKQWKNLDLGIWNGQQVCKWGSREVTDKFGNPVIDPFTNEPMREAARNGMFDPVLAVPKSLTEMFVRARTDAQAREISLAIHRAGIATWHECVATARVARVNTGKVEGLGPEASKAKQYGQDRVPAELMAIPIMQYANRDGMPHLHLHLPTFTACQVDGRWLTADTFNIFRTAAYRNAVFDTHLVREMQALGYRMEIKDLQDSRDGKFRYEAADSSKSLREFWSSGSTRAEETRAAFQERYGRQPTEIELQRLMTQNRPKKHDKEQDQNPDRGRWIEEAKQEAAKAIGKLKTDAAKARAIKNWDCSPVEPSPAIKYAPLPERTALLRERLLGEKGLCITNARFLGTEIRPAIARLAVDLGMTPEERFAFEEEFRQELIVDRASADDRFAYFTTQQILDAEKLIHDCLEERKSGYKAVPEHFITLAAKSLGLELDDSQMKVLLAACGESGITFVEAAAGTGKTTTAQAIVSAHSISGTSTQFFYTTRNSKLAEEAGEKLRGVDNWGSLVALRKQILEGKFKPDRNTLIIADEVGVFDTFLWAEVIKILNGAKIICMGDSEQLASIGASGHLADAKEHHEFLELTKVHRHIDPADTLDFGLIREGKGMLAAANLAARGRIHVSEDHDEKVRLAVEHFQFHMTLGKTSEQIRIIIDTTNHDVDQANALVQQHLRSLGEIKGEGFHIKESQQNRNWYLHEGDSIVMLKAYSEKGMGRKDRWVTVRNGSQGKVLRIDHEAATAKVQLAGGRLATIKLDEKVGLAYAQHTSKFQGGEVDVVLGLPGKGSTANSIYSMLTRCKEQAHVFLDYVTHTTEAAIRFGEQASNKEVKHSAHYYLNHQTAFASEKMQGRAKDLMGFIDETFDYSLAESIISSPAFDALVVRAEAMSARGLDANAAIAKVIAERELSTAEDTAKVIIWRLDRHSEYAEQAFEDFDWEELDPELRADIEARARLSEYNYRPERREQDQGMGRSL